MKHITLGSLLFASALLFSLASQAQNPVNWTEKQLIEPATLAQTINSKKDVPLILSVGPGASIPQSVEIGTTNTPEGIDKLKAHLKQVKKDQPIVIYCGCCPFEHCPNVRPAIEVLKAMQFTNYRLLNLPHNIKKDWIDKGYPVISNQ
ncbi:MAG TPA: rhodanese-like domain-containing protein [Flavisolibacter sp.]|nr:rhodanese-like domain-containing protein [Flavisolibacter sp.]